MAIVEVMEPMQALSPHTDVIIDVTKTDAGTEGFDPKKHLKFKKPPQVHTMGDIALPEDFGVSPVAVSEPFELFTEQAVQRMRNEIFRPRVMENFQYSSNLSKCQLRGYAAKEAPFIYDTWKNPEVLGIISQIAGIELVPAMDLEIGHINLSTKTEDQKNEEVAALTDKKLTEADEGIAGCPWEDDKPIVDWHTDSYPFVCVTMLSDCTDMVGGETALRTGTGDILKVRGPGMGCAVVLQGRYIEHQALRAFGTTERITSVTSFRPKHHSVKDDTVLTTVRPISDLSELYGQFSEYRLDMLEKRFQEQRKALIESMKAGKKFDTRAMKNFLREQGDFVAHMTSMMIDDELVVKGSIVQSHLLSGQGKNKRKKTE